MRTGGRRELVSGFSGASQRNLVMVAANAGGTFCSHLTITCRSLTDVGKDEGEPSLLIARRAKKDLNRFLTSIRYEIGR